MKNIEVQKHAPDRILRLPEVERITGHPKPTLYMWMKQGRFPKPLKTGARSVGWLESVVTDWRNSRPLAA